MLTAFDNILRARDAFFKGLASLRPVTCIETTVGCKKKKKNQGKISNRNQLSGRFQKVEVQSLDYVCTRLTCGIFERV